MLLFNGEKCGLLKEKVRKELMKVEALERKRERKKERKREKQQTNKFKKKTNLKKESSTKET